LPPTANQVDRGDNQPAEPIPMAVTALVATAVFAFATLVRLPATTESLWLDELHSAWAVWGDFGDVRQRAAMGNQSPTFYWLLWAWHQAFGDTEPALRSLSVIFSSLAAAVTAAGVTRLTGNVVAGAIGGLFLAIEPNAIFFGTEVRAFAPVMLLTAIACWAWVSTFRSSSRLPVRALLACVGLATMIQPMSLGLLAWPPIELFWRRRHSLHLNPRRMLLVAIATLASAWAGWVLFGKVLTTAWQHRYEWQAAMPTGPATTILTVWPWAIGMIAVAVTAALLAMHLNRSADRRAATDEDHCPSEHARIGPWDPGWLAPASLAMGATALYWSLSASGVAPIFHRRFMVGVVVLMAWAFGVATHQLMTSLGRIRRGRFGRQGDRPAVRKVVQWGLPIALLLWSLLCGVRVATNPEAYARPLRSEDWRGARELIAQYPNEPVWLAPGLIETQRLLSGNDPNEIAYLTFPLQGPYPLGRVEPISLRPGAVDDALRTRLAAGHPWWAVLRASPRQRGIDWANGVALRAGGKAELSFESYPFGRLTLIRFTPRP
jgi:hypothetical protein